MDLANYDAAFANFQNAAAALAGDSRPILKFDKGEWYAGQNSEEIPLGTKLAADMMRAEWGWVRWHDKKPAERRMTLVASGQQPAPRDTLGHNDPDLWARDPNNGKPIDPWQKTIEIPVRELDGERREFIIAGGSKGFEGACKALFGAFGKEMRENMGKVPVIALGGGKYSHPTYGVVKVPELPLAEWASLDEPAPKKKALTKF